ncbi:hypothetical protein D1872_248890 [compost metagenome]
MNYIEFLYSIYSVRATIDSNNEVKRAIEFIQYIRSEYPNIMMTNSGNQERVREDLNRKHEVGFSEKNVWTDRTTTGNQYRFIVNHLLMFEGIFSLDTKRKIISVTAEGFQKIEKLLDSSEKAINDPNFKYGRALWIE